MPSIPEKDWWEKYRKGEVLNLVISGMPSIQNKIITS